MNQISDPEQLLLSLRRTFAKCVEIARRKNADYAGSDNPFRNLESCRLLRISPEKGMLVRILDKINRIDNLLDKPPAVVGESLEDAIDDAINYLALLKAYREETEGRKAEELDSVGWRAAD